MLQHLLALSQIAARVPPDSAAVNEACALLRDALGAEDAYVLCAGDPHFARLDSEDDPTQYEVKQKGYWLVWRQLASQPDLAGGLFTVRERLVTDGALLVAGQPSTHLAVLLPSDESNSELLVVRGPWPDGIGQEAIDLVTTARPMIAYLVANALDSQRRGRQRAQLDSLAAIARAFTEAREVDNVLTAGATAVANASGMDWVAIYLLNEAGDLITETAGNFARHSGTETQMISLRPNNPWIVSVARELRESARPRLIRDVFAPEEGLPEDLQVYYQRAHILSSAIFQLSWHDRLLGLIIFSASTHHAFDAEEEAFLQTLVSQATSTIVGLELYRELEEASRIHHFLARTDALTGIPNRRYLEEVLKAEAARAQRFAEPLSVVMADLDYFKLVNDNFGHQAGDETLKQVADLARDSCRVADFVGRWGGDEFLFILPRTDLRGAGHVAERFRRAVTEACLRGSRKREPLRLSVSAGVAQSRPHVFDPHVLVEGADAALYRAKAQGRNRIAYARLRAVAA